MKEISSHFGADIRVRGWREGHGTHPPCATVALKAVLPANASKSVRPRVGENVSRENENIS